MKQLRMIILGVLLAMAGGSYATDELTAGNVTMKPGENATLSVGLTNETTMIAFEFWMQLPDGVTIAKDEDDDYAVVKSSTRLNKHDLVVSLDDDGRYHFLCYANPQKNIKESAGELLSIELSCAENVANGSFQAIVEDIIFSDADRVRHDLSDCTFQVTVRAGKIGDVNKDDHVDVADVTALVNILTSPQPLPEGMGASYDIQAADVDGNGRVEVADVAELVNMTLSNTDM